MWHWYKCQFVRHKLCKWWVTLFAMLGQMWQYNNRKTIVKCHKCPDMKTIGVYQNRSFTLPTVPMSHMNRWPCPGDAVLGVIYNLPHLQCDLLYPKPLILIFVVPILCRASQKSVESFLLISPLSIPDPELFLLFHIGCDIVEMCSTMIHSPFISHCKKDAVPVMQQKYFMYEQIIR